MKKNKTRIRKPVIKWQTGEFQRTQTFRFELPLQFLMLCKLTDTSPQQMLTDFMDNLSCGSWKREGRDKVKQFLIEYFIEHGYGKDFYTPEDLKMMFRELDAMGLLFPKDGEQELVDAYSAWRQIQQEFLFNKWYNR